MAISDFRHRAGLPECAALIVGGGSGNRFGGDKLSILIAGEPLLAWTLLAFEQTEAISSIIVVAPSGREEEFGKIARKAEITKLTAIVAGGSHRHDSVSRGLGALSPGVELVAIHDAARPLVTPELIARCLEAALPTGASAAAAPITDTLHQADQEQCAVRTVDRTGLWAMQTPQVFRAAPLMRLLEGPEMSRQDKPTDEVSLALTAGWKVPFVENQQPNIKVTWPSDREMAEALINWRRRSV